MLQHPVQRRQGKWCDYPCSLQWRDNVFLMYVLRLNAITRHRWSARCLDQNSAVELHPTTHNEQSTRLSSRGCMRRKAVALQRTYGLSAGQRTSSVEPYTATLQHWRSRAECTAAGCEQGVDPAEVSISCVNEHRRTQAVGMHETLRISACGHCIKSFAPQEKHFEGT